MDDVSFAKWRINLEPKIPSFFVKPDFIYKEEMESSI